MAGYVPREVKPAPVGRLALAGALALAACQVNANRGERLLVSGTIEAIEVDLAAEVNGVLTERPLSEGKRVEKGGLVGRIDPALYRVRLEETEAAVQQARAQLTLALRGYRNEEILAAAQHVSELEAETQNAEANLRRVERLFQEKVVSEQDVDLAHRGRDVSRARLAATRQNYQKLAAGLRIEDIDAARANVRRLEAAMERARLDLAHTEVLSPLSGLVTQVMREAGEYVVAGTPILSVADLANLYCWVYLSELDVGLLRLGDGAEVRIDAYPGRSFPGTVSYISPQAEFTPRNVQTREERVNLVFAVKVLVPNPDGALKVGLPADVEMRRHAPAGE